jgi:CDP-diacylglycerol--glycerol-3-phosphate 3-phosphatidyltransferase
MAGQKVTLNAANTVTVSRVVLTPVFLVVLLANWPQWIAAPAWLAALKPILAAAIFTLLAATDGVDGYLARSRNEVTTFGKFIDPLADKLLVTAALLALIELDVLPAWVALVIISREFIVSGLRMVASAEGRVIAASVHGKIKTVLQIIAIIMFLIKDSLAVRSFGPDVSIFAQSASWTVMGAAIIITIASMIDYFRKAADVLVGPWSGTVPGELPAAEDAEDDLTD